MATVWAYRFGNYEEDPSTGWSHSMHFHSLLRLMKEMDRHKLIDRVTRLGIVAHGDSGGLVQLDRDLTPESICSFQRELGQLVLYLTLHGQLIFYSCIAGAGSKGSRLLMEISKFLPGRTIIGFDIKGMGAKAGLSAKPGQVEAARSTAGAEVSWSQGYRLDLYGRHAKWALNGEIVLMPHDERMTRSYYCTNPKCKGHYDYDKEAHPPCPGFRRVMNPCANPKCQGHKTLGDVCEGWHPLRPNSGAEWKKCP